MTFGTLKKYGNRSKQALNARLSLRLCLMASSLILALITTLAIATPSIATPPSATPIATKGSTGKNNSAKNSVTPSWSLATLMADMAKIKSRSAHFSEIKHLSIMTQPVNSSGKLLYKAPDYIERRIEKPAAGYFISEKTSIRIKNPGQKKEIKVVSYQFPAIEAFVEAMRGILSGNLKTLKKNFDVKLSGSRANWTMELTPQDEEMLDYVEKLKFQGKGTKLFKVDTLSSNGDRSIVNISKHSD